MTAIESVVMQARALEALKGVGDLTLGEWREKRPTAIHIRRRLSADEEVRVGPVVDIRGTLEAKRRLAKMRYLLPTELCEAEAGKIEVAL